MKLKMGWFFFMACLVFVVFLDDIGYAQFHRISCSIMYNLSGTQSSTYRGPNSLC